MPQHPGRKLMSVERAVEQGERAVGSTSPFLAMDTEREIHRITRRIREELGGALKRRGLVVAISGGIDSSVCAALAVRAVGPDRVVALILPEKDSSPTSRERAERLADYLGMAREVEDIAPALEALGCYRRRDEAIRRVIPGYGPGWKSKIVIAGGAQGQFNYFRLVAESPEGTPFDERLGAREYLEIVAATNFKQRIRKTFEYYYADKLNFAVVGTPNRLEYDQGFFVKNGDGSADIKPIAHLYKTQVYALAEALGLPGEICSAQPSTDTYSLPQGQDEFYFVLPYQKMDVALWAHNSGKTAEELAEMIGLTVSGATAIYADIEAKRRATRYLHLSPRLIAPVPEVAGQAGETRLEAP